MGPKKQNVWQKNHHTLRKSLYFVNTMNDSMSQLDMILKNNMCHELKVYQNQISKKKKKMATSVGIEKEAICCFIF